MAATANVRAVITAEDRASAVLAGFSNSAQSFGNKVTNTMKTAAIAFTAAGTAASTFALKSAADFEQTRIGLENMLGSADKAKTLLSDISKFAANTPFEFPELAQATKQLVAFGFSAEDAFNTMQQLGDVSAAVGAPINDLAYLMGTLRTQGRAFTIDIRQFAQRGIPIYEYLAKVLKTNEQTISRMIEEGKIGFPEVQKAFQMMTAEGGKFHKTMEKQSKSLTGLFSTLKDNIGLAARELVGISEAGDIKAGSPMEKLKIAAEWLTKNLPRLIDKFKETAKEVSEYLSPKIKVLADTLEDMWPTISSLAASIGGALVVAIGFGVDALNALLKASEPMLNFLKDNTWIIWGLVGAFAAWKTAMLISGVVNGVIAAMTLLQASVIATTATMGAATTSAGLLRAALLILTTPWQLTLAIVGVAAVVAGIKEINDAFDHLKKKIDDVNAKKVNVGNTNFQVSGGSDIGLVEQLRRKLQYRASGGPVSANQGYIVGEDGPEYFVPSSSGKIIPNQKSVSTTSSPQNINITVQAGAFMGSQQDARKYAMMIMDAYKDAMLMNGVKI